MPGTRKLGRATDNRMAMLRAMVTYLLENGRIETTVTRAKEVRSVAEKYIALARIDNLALRRQALSFITKEDVVRKLFIDIGPHYAGRSGGYTRVMRIGPRRGDAAEMAIIELVDYAKPAPAAQAEKPKRGRAAKADDATKAPAAKAPARRGRTAKPATAEAAE